MAENTGKKSTGKIILIVAIIVIGVASILYGIYGMYFEFNDQDVSDYIKEEANNYPEDKRAAVTKILSDGVKDILKDRELSNQVLTYANSNGTPREMELVHAAIMRARSFGYLQ